MKTLLAAILFLGICIIGMCFNIIFRKKKFPETEISRNENMRKMGIKCMREQEDEMFGNERQRKKQTSCTGVYDDSCVGCGFYPFEKQIKDKEK